MAAAVGVRAAGDANLTAAGTFSTTTRKPVYAGQTATGTYAPFDLDANAQIQGAALVGSTVASSVSTTVATTNPFQEVNLFVGDMARLLAVAPRAAMDRIMEILQALMTQNQFV